VLLMQSATCHASSETTLKIVVGVFIAVPIGSSGDRLYCNSKHVQILKLRAQEGVTFVFGLHLLVEVCQISGGIALNQLASVTYAGIGDAYDLTRNGIRPDQGLVS
jgi:hypothetical protein